MRTRLDMPTTTAPDPWKISLDDVIRVVRRVEERWPEVPHITVVTTTQDLPIATPSVADGLYHDGQLYIVAGNIKTEAQLHKVLAHECIFHHSLWEMLGNYGLSKLHHGLQDLKRRGDATITHLANDVHDRYGILSPEQETQEIVAAAGERCLDEHGEFRVGYGFMKQAYASAVSWLRDRGISVAFTNLELQGLLLAARDRAEGGRECAHTIRTPDVGRYIGKIVSLGFGIATQRIGRDNRTVNHDVARLSVEPVVGDVIDIQYVAGKGHVTAIDRVPQLGR